MSPNVNIDDFASTSFKVVFYYINFDIHQSLFTTFCCNTCFLIFSRAGHQLQLSRQSSQLRTNKRRMSLNIRRLFIYEFESRLLWLKFWLPWQLFVKTLLQYIYSNFQQRWANATTVATICHHLRLNNCRMSLNIGRPCTYEFESRFLWTKF